MNTSPSHYRILIIISLLCMTMMACKERGSVRPIQDSLLDGPAEKILDLEYDTLRYFQALDSVYASLPSKGTVEEWRFYERKVSALFWKGYQERALVYVDSMLALVEPYKDDPAYAEIITESYFTIGDIYVRQRQYMIAFNWYSKIKNLSLLANPLIFAHYNSRLSVVSYNQGKYMEAASYAKEALGYYYQAETDSLKMFKTIQGVLDNIGLAYSKAGMNDSARFYYNEALNYINVKGKKFSESKSFVEMAAAVVKGNLAEIDLREGNLSAAKKLLNESVAVNERPQNAPLDAAFSRVKLARLYFKEKNIAESERMLQLAEHANEQAPKPLFEVKMAILPMRAELAAVRREYDKAYGYLALHKHLDDSITRLNEQFNTPYIHQIAKNIDNSYRVLMLERDNQLKSRFIWGAVAIVLIMVGMLILLLISQKRVKQHLASLKELHLSLSMKNITLQKTLETLEESQHSHNKLMRVITHDLRGPVGSIASLADLARDGSVTADQIKGVMSNIGESANKSVSLINELLNDLTASVKLKDPVNVRLDEVIRYSAELFDKQIGEKDIELELDLQKGFVLAEESRLWRVYSNLIGNAIKFSKEGGVVQISMARNGNTWLVSIKDNGIGIPADQMSGIFSATAAGRKGTANEQSYGLGLFITKQIVEQHNGRIWVDSDGKNGTEVHVALPVALI